MDSQLKQEFGKTPLPDAAELITKYVSEAGAQDKETFANVIAGAAARAIAEGQNAEWPAPTPLEIAPAAEFPVNVLPNVLARYATDVARIVQVPFEMPAMIGLVVYSIAVARRFNLHVGSLYATTTNLWAICIAHPSERKTETYNRMLAPLREWETERIDLIKPQIEMADHLTDAHDKLISSLKIEAGKASLDDDQRTAARERLRAAVENPPLVPLDPRLLLEDVTVEKLAHTLSRQEDQVIAIASDEGSQIFATMAGRYSNNNEMNITLYLKGHKGEPYIYSRVGATGDRKGSKDIYLRQPIIPMALCIQPGYIGRLRQRPEFRELGFLARFLYCVCPSLVGQRLIDIASYQDLYAETAGVKDAYSRSLRDILDMPPRIEADPTARYWLRFSDPAFRTWADFYNEVESASARGSDLEEISDWAGKLANSVARIAAIFHVVEDSALQPWRSQISEAVMRRACQLGYFLLAHGAQLFDLFERGKAPADADYILNRIRDKQLRIFTVRQLQQTMRSQNQLRRTEMLLPVIELLEMHGFVRSSDPNEQRKAGHSPKAPFYAHPAIFDCAAPDCGPEK